MHKHLKRWLALAKIAELARAAEQAALDDAEQVPVPKRLRPATAADCATVGRIIWYPRHYEPGETPGWLMVEEPLHYGDEFKAFCAHDGCRYGLDGAFVEPERTKPRE